MLIELIYQNGLIAAALARSMPDKPSGPDWIRGLAVAPGAGVALLPELACPACWPAYAALVSSFGLSFLRSTEYLLGVGLMFLAWPQFSPPNLCWNRVYSCTQELSG